MRIVDDVTEDLRRVMVENINADPGSREGLEAQHGRVWNTEELTKEFRVLGFMAPFVIVTNLETGKKGSLTFQHHPRFYFLWSEDSR